MIEKAIRYLSRSLTPRNKTSKGELSPLPWICAPCSSIINANQDNLFTLTTNRGLIGIISLLVELEVQVSGADRTATSNFLGKVGA